MQSTGSFLKKEGPQELSLARGLWGGGNLED